jgi:ubiquitin carboxyl-terminal hydrolase 36/42
VLSLARVIINLPYIALLLWLLSNANLNVHSSGKCQIIHWRQGHKQTCQQWNVNGGSSSGGLPTTESSEQMPFLTNLNSPLPGGDVHLHDMNFDTVSEPSFGTTDSYNFDPDLFPTDRTNINKSNQNLHSTENGASVVSCEKSNYSVDEKTNSSEILSANKVACCTKSATLNMDWRSNSIFILQICFIQSFTLCFQVSNNSFSCSDEKDGNCDLTYPLNGSIQQPNSCAPETRKRPKASITVYEPDMGVYLTSDMISSCEGQYASTTGSLQRSSSCGKSSGKGNIIHKKPPYPPGKVASSQKPQEVSTSYQCDGHDMNPCSKIEQSKIFFSDDV